MYIFFSKPLEKSCQVWYNITVRISAQKLIDNKHPLISGMGQWEKIGQKWLKNVLIINAAAYRTGGIDLLYWVCSNFLFFLSLKDKTESRRGGWGEDCAC